MGEIFPRPQAPIPMPTTGERLTSELSGQTQIEHMHRYVLARQLCRGKDVIDVASGEGYGSALLAQTAASVIGIEIAADAVAHAAHSYRRSNLRFLRGDARALGLAKASTDVVVSFETIEHLAEQEIFLSEIRRVLRPGGMLIVSTPDEDNYSPADSPANPFHVLELTEEEFAHLLGRHFPHVRLLRQRSLIGSVILPSPPTEAESPTLTFEKRGDHLECSNGLPRPQYVVAVASDRPIALLPSSVYIEKGRVGFIDEDLDGYMRSATEALRRETEALRRELEEERDANTRAIDVLAAEKTAAEARINALQGELDAERAVTAALTAEKTETGVRGVELQRALDASRAGSAALERACERAEEAAFVSRQELAVFRERASQQEGRIAELLSSSSWRITAPLRAVFGPLRRR
jgi:SAM-dependent methyltransferase